MRKILLLTLFLAGPLGACTKEASRKLERAKLDAARAEQKVAGEQTTLAAEQAEKRDQLAQSHLEDQVAHEHLEDHQVATLEREQRDERARADADHRKLLATKKSNVRQASVKLAEARAKVEADARKRLAKIDARVRDLSAKTNRMDEEGQARVGDSWAGFANKHTEAVDAIQTIEQVPAVSLAIWETEVDARFDQLDTVLTKIERDLK